jgi:multisubunit Na+/H+ antiporter MnhG subunit
MSDSARWSLMALILGFAGAVLNALAASGWRKFEPGHTRWVLSDKDAEWVPPLTMVGWVLIILGGFCGVIGIIAS